MKPRLKIAPSLLAADFTRLKEEIQRVEKAGADLLHIDIMDGHFVPNISVGPLIVQAVRQISRLDLCVHLMIEKPWKFIDEFAKTGCQEIIIHIEAARSRTQDCLNRIRKKRIACGISLKPETPVRAIRPYLHLVKTVLVMTVHPGFGGQSFLPEMLPKIREIRSIFKGDLAVDGGIRLANIKEVRLAGANVIVAGTAIFKEPNAKAAIQRLRC